jgi:putative ABC transport system permease protein
LQGDTANTTETQWGWYDFLTYIQLKPGTDYKQLEAKLPAFCTRYYPDLNWARANKAHDELHMLPVQDIHLHSNYYQEAEVNGSAASVDFIFLIAMFILAIAWINYINLATARSVERAKEVSIRKVLGASRGSLVQQFLGESLMLNIGALLPALITVLLLTPAFNRFVGHNASPGLFTMPGGYWLLFFGIFAAGTLLAACCCARRL